MYKSSEQKKHLSQLIGCFVAKQPTAKLQATWLCLAIRTYLRLTLSLAIYFTLSSWPIDE